MRASYNAAATTNIRKPRRRRANQLEDEDGQSSADFGDEEDQDDFSSLGSLPGGVASSVAPNQSGHDVRLVLLFIFFGGPAASSAGPPKI
eukprot:SAG31_NODE_332_length_17516_cov_3.552840_8_plen_90_part_00